MLRRPGVTTLGQKTLSAPGLLSAPFVQLNADGWSADYSGTPPTFDPENNPVQFDVTRAGFNGSGQATTYVDRLFIGKRVRLPVQAGGVVTLSPNTVACSSVIYADDTIAGGATNLNTTIRSPKPVANWAIVDQQLIGNSLYWEITVWHRNFRAGGQHAACVKVTAAEAGGANPVTQIVTTPVVSPRASDKNKVVVYAGTLDVSGLFSGSAGVVQLDAEVYPWVGVASSVLKTSDYSAARDFSRRYYWKDTARFNAPPLAYVSSSGNNTTGTWSTNATTASGAPFLTVAGALNAISAANGSATGNYVDGCRIRIKEGGAVSVGSVTTTRNSKGAALIIEPDPAASSPAACVLTMDANFRPKLGNLTAPMTESCVVFTGGLTINRTTTAVMQGEATPKMRFVLDGDVNFNWSGGGSTLFSNSHGYLQGAVLTNLPANALGVASTGEYRLMRGVSGDVNGGGVDGWLLLGCTLSRPATVSARNGATRSNNRAIRAFNKFLRITTPGGFDNVGSDENIPDGCVRACNLYESIGANGFTTTVTNADGASGSVTHAITIGNTATGWGNDGRWNFHYEDFQASAPERSSTLCVFAGNLIGQFNIKGDRFCFTNEGLSLALSQQRIHNWSVMFGVDCFGNYASFCDAQSGTPASGSHFSPEYWGKGSLTGTSLTVPRQAMASLFTNYQGTTGAGAGAGNGTYTLPVGSAARGIVFRSVVTHDLLGNARPATGDAAGCYAG